MNYGGAINISKEVRDRFNNGEVITSKDQIHAVGKMVSIQRGVKIKYDWFIVH